VSLTCVNGFARTSGPPVLDGVVEHPKGLRSAEGLRCVAATR
jgi:hypothetical protein